MFNGETDGRKNKEFIWGRTTGNLCIRESFPHSMDGYNGMGVTQKMVNMFYMNDGTDNYPEDAKPYKEDGTYDNTNFSTEDETFSEYVLKSGVFNMPTSVSPAVSGKPAHTAEAMLKRSR